MGPKVEHAIPVVGPGALAQLGPTARLSAGSAGMSKVSLSPPLLAQQCPRGFNLGTRYYFLSLGDGLCFGSLSSWSDGVGRMCCGPAAGMAEEALPKGKGQVEQITDLSKRVVLSLGKGLDPRPSI